MLLHDAAQHSNPHQGRIFKKKVSQRFAVQRLTNEFGKAPCGALNMLFRDIDGEQANGTIWEAT
jgi:hypothetical protein